MSTKTSIKRIALVAVSALSIGLMATPSANAARANASSVANAEVNVGLVASSASTAVGESQVFTMQQITTGTAMANADAFDIAVKVTSFPSSLNGVNVTIAAPTDAVAGTAGVQVNNADATAATGAFTVGAAEGSGTTDPFFRLAALADVTTNTNGEKITIGTAAFTPSVAGSYTLTIWGDTVADGLLGAGEVSSTITITATAAGAKTEFSNSLGGATTDRVTSLTMAATVPTSRVGVLGSMTASWKVTSSTTGNGLAAGDGIAAGDGAVTVAYQLSKPAGSTAALSAASQTAANTVTTGAVSTETSAQAMTAVTFTPDVAGTYTITAWHDADRDSVVDNGELSASASYVVAADAPVITIKTFNSTSPTGAHGASARGVLMRLTLTNGGVAGSLADGENITVSVSGAAVVSRISTTSYGQVTNTTNSYSINRAQLDSKGRVWVTINDASPETVVATVKGSGGSVKDINQTVSLTFADIQATNPDAVTTFTNTTGVKSTTANTTVGAGGNLGVFDVDYLKATAVVLKSSSSAASTKVGVHVTDTSAHITGLANAAYATYATSSDGTADSNAYNFTWTAPAVFGTGLVADGDSFTVDFGDDASDDDGAQIRAKAAADTSVTADQSTSIRAKNASALTLSAVVKDQFGIAMPNVAVAITLVAGSRNAHVVQTNAVSDANGRVSVTYTDAPLTGVVATTDTVRFKATNVANYDVTVTWAATVGVSKVVAYGGNTASTGVTSATPTFNDIKANGGAVTYGEGAEEGAKAIYAKVTDASGSVLVGVPVTFSVAGTGAEIATNAVTAYTNSTGVATSSIYGWIKGTYTYTATADGVSSTGTISFAQTDATASDQRTISAAVSGSLVTATVKDRFGNPVPNVKVWATKSGAGYFGNGLAKTDGTTDQNGEVSFTVAGADADVTVATYDKSDVTAKGSGQTCALAGNVDCSATAPTAFDAYVAGTATKGSTGVGASFAPAGVAEATVKVTGVQAATQAATDAANAAADAAAEAIDAANAATDAANLAAEAADAATVAAEEARDAADAATAAVEELATQVATLMAALKAQITTLANTVAKIAKKVKA